MPITETWAVHVNGVQVARYAAEGRARVKARIIMREQPTASVHIVHDRTEELPPRTYDTRHTRGEE